MPPHFPPRKSFIVPLAHGGALHLGSRPLVMGILNVTPDSFSNAQPLIDPGAAIDLALRMEADGADIMDIGGESTRPNATPLPLDDELARVVPVIRGLAGRLRIPISIDTYKADVARAALAEGASIANDVSGLRHGPALARVVAEARAALIVMHSRGTPETMSDQAVYADLMAEVIGELGASLEVATQAGVALDQLIVDPGVGFAKRSAHSYGVLARLPELAVALGRPLLVGPSRKGFMRDASGGREAVARDWGTAAAVSAAVLAGAHIVRVHAVAEMVQVARVAEEIRKHSHQP